MAKIGYIHRSGEEDINDVVMWMKQEGCQEIILEETDSTSVRAKWRELVGSLVSGDTLVIKSLANVLSYPQNITVLFLMIAQRNVRLISYLDKLDSIGKIWPNLNNLEWIKKIAYLHEEIIHQERDMSRIRALSVLKRSEYPTSLSRKDRDALIANLYTIGIPISAIMAETGIMTRSTIYTILHNQGIQIDRRSTPKSSASEGTKAEEK